MGAAILEQSALRDLEDGEKPMSQCDFYCYSIRG
jgi:hypothetical protein